MRYQVREPGTGRLLFQSNTPDWAESYVDAMATEALTVHDTNQDEQEKHNALPTRTH